MYAMETRGAHATQYHGWNGPWIPFPEELQMSVFSKTYRITMMEHIPDASTVRASSSEQARNWSSACSRGSFPYARYRAYGRRACSVSGPKLPFPGNEPFFRQETPGFDLLAYSMKIAEGISED